MSLPTINDHFTAADGTVYRIDAVLKHRGQIERIDWHAYRMTDGHATVADMGTCTGAQWLAMKARAQVQMLAAE